MRTNDYQQQRAAASTPLPPICSKIRERLDSLVLVTYDWLSLYEYHHKIPYLEQDKVNSLPWIVASGRFEVLQYKKGGPIVLKTIYEPFPPLRERKKTRLSNDHLHLVKISDLITTSYFYNKGGIGYDGSESLFRALFPLQEL